VNRFLIIFNIILFNTLLLNSISNIVKIVSNFGRNIVLPILMVCKNFKSCEIFLNHFENFDFESKSNRNLRKETLKNVLSTAD